MTINRIEYVGIVSELFFYRKMRCYDYENSSLQRNTNGSRNHHDEIAR